VHRGRRGQKGFEGDVCTVYWEVEVFEFFVLRFWWYDSGDGGGGEVRSDWRHFFGHWELRREFGGEWEVRCIVLQLFRPSEHLLQCAVFAAFSFLLEKYLPRSQDLSSDWT